MSPDAPLESQIRDLARPVEIAPRIHWVGCHRPDDRFQAHAYLIEHGENSVLIDPGPHRSAAETRRKIAEIVPFGHVRYFVCQHQDPDITSSLPLLLADPALSDRATIVTHWRVALLMQHMGLDVPTFEVDAHAWRLDLGGRVLQFVFTPYLHFPGAFCTFDKATGTLFSSDLFGGFSEAGQLWAESEDELEGMDTFHEHYMPSREILQHGLARLEALPLERIAPQHGLVIPKKLLPAAIGRLKRLECGLFLMAEENSELRHLLVLGRLVRDTLRSVACERELKTIVGSLIERLERVVPVASLEFVVANADGDALRLAPENRFHGEPCEALEELERAFAEGGECATLAGGKVALALAADDPRCRSYALFSLESRRAPGTDLNDALARLAEPLAVALDRELAHRSLQKERDQLYQRSMRDPLTGLYTRHVVDDAVDRLMRQRERDPKIGLCLVAFDVDHFKRVNDSYGHPVGDEVLRRLGETVRSHCRSIDVPVRYGGEEIFVYLQIAGEIDAVAWAERMRRAVAALEFTVPTGSFRVTISAGVALHRAGESRESLDKRADAALYAAKRAGRDRVEVASVHR